MDQVDFEFEKDEPVEYKLTRDELGQAVLFNTDWTVETAVSQLTKDHITLDPAFQRRDAWRIDKKSRFIESLLLGLPIPQIVLAEDKSNRGRFIVLDGKQRLLTLLQFAGHARSSKWNEFKLKDLHYLELEGLRFRDLSSDRRFDQDVRAFWNYPIRSSIIRNWPNTRYLETVFIRLNEGSLKLSPQELRQALVPGPFSTYVDKVASESKALHRLLRIHGPDFRMRDTELLLRFLSFTLYPEQYAGDMKGFLDSVTNELNANWQSMSRHVESAVQDIESSIQFGLDTLGDQVFARKWDTKTRRFSPYLNRAIAEVEVFYFRNAEVRRWIAENPRRFIDLLSHLTTSEPRFRDSIESTTKSIAAVDSRFQILGRALRSEASSLAVLKLENGRFTQDRT